MANYFNDRFLIGGNFSYVHAKKIIIILPFLWNQNLLCFVYNTFEESFF